MILIAESPSRRTEYRRYLGNAGLEKQALSEKLTTEKERDKAKAEAETARLEATEERKKAEDARQEVAKATKSAAVALEQAEAAGREAATATADRDEAKGEAETARLEATEERKKAEDAQQEVAKATKSAAVALEQAEAAGREAATATADRDEAKGEAETARLEATEERKKAEDARQEVAKATKSAAVALEQAEAAGREAATATADRDEVKAQAETARLEATEERKKAEDARQEVAEATKSAAVAEERAASLTKENENRLDNLRLLWDNVERANPEKQSAEEEEKRAKAQITDFRAEAERLNAHLSTLKKQEIQYLRDDLEEIISERLRDMVTWREKASALAKSIVENDDEDARLLSVEILKDASTSQALPETVIKAYSSDRSRENFERIRHIIGITADQFQDIVQDGANYKMWIHVQKFGYFGTLVNTGEIPIDVLLFRYFDNNIISDVRLWSKYSSVRLPSFDDWYQTRTYRVYLDAIHCLHFELQKKRANVDGTSSIRMILVQNSFLVILALFHTWDLINF